MEVASNNDSRYLLTICFRILYDLLHCQPLLFFWSDAFRLFNACGSPKELHKPLYYIDAT